MMALTRHYQLLLCLSFAVTALCFFSFTFLPPKSGGNGIEASRNDNEEELRKMILGSRPPGCVNKCMSCRPCEATLVIPPVPHLNLMSTNNRIKSRLAVAAAANNYYYDQESSSSSHREDDSYYLLSWKCRCGNKLYQP